MLSLDKSSLTHTHDIDYHDNPQYNYGMGPLKKRHLTRRLNLKPLLSKKSLFLFGARGTGKSTLIKDTLPHAIIVDLLDTDTFARLTRRPKLIEEETPPSARLVVIDEIQLIPDLLNIVHRMIESRNTRFLLTGSSARKLRRKGVNLLGGRAWEARLFGLTSQEIPDFNLIQYLNRGGLPSVYLGQDPREDLRAYINLYLKEEIRSEALARNLSGFSRFIETMAVQNSEELHFEGIASDVGVSPATVRNYIEVLEDTLFGFQVSAFTMTKKRKAISRSKFYLFDVGIAGALAKRGEIAEGGELFGRAFEHFIMQEVRACTHYLRSESDLTYWRSTSGFEVDAIIGHELALEVKSTDLVTERHLKGLKALRDEQLIRKYAVVSRDPVRRIVDGILILPWQEFLKDLWAGKYT